MHSEVSTKIKRTFQCFISISFHFIFIKHLSLSFFNDLNSCMLCNVLITTAESNSIGFRFAILNRFESIRIDYNHVYCLLTNDH